MNLTGLPSKTSTNFHSAGFLSSGFRCQTGGYGSNFTFSPIQLNLTPSRTGNLMTLHGFCEVSLRAIPANGFSRVLWSGLPIRHRFFQQGLQLHEEVGVHSDPPTKIQDDFTGMFDHSGGPIHDLLQYRLQSPALGGVSNGRNLSGQSQLPQQTQTVVSKRSQMHDGIVGVEFTRGQTLQVQYSGPKFLDSQLTFMGQVCSAPDDERYWYGAYRTSAEVGETL